MRFAWAAACLCLARLAAQSPEEALAAAERERQRGLDHVALEILERACAAHPARASLHFDRGAVLAALGRFAEAADALRSGLALDPANPPAQLTLAKALLSDHRYDRALDRVERYAALVGPGGSAFEIHHVRGVALRHLGHLAEAEVELRQAVAIRPSHADALHNLGAVLADRGEHRAAAEALQRAKSAQPDSADIRYRLARVLRQLGDEVGAEAELTVFEGLRRRGQRQAQVSVLLGRAERALNAGEAEQAKDLYQHVIRQDPGNAQAHANLGVAYERLGRGDLAELMFRKASELEPNYAEAHLNLGLKLAAKGSFAEAERSVSEALRLAPASLAALEAMGMVLTRLGRPTEALPYFEQVAKRTPDSSEASLNVGIAYAEAGRREEALERFARAVRLAPDSAQAHYNAGRALHDLGRADQAAKALERAVALDGSNVLATQLLSRIERARGNVEEAVELLRRVAALEPGNAAAHHDLALALAESGAEADAVRHWERALKLDPRHGEALYNLAQALQPSAPERAEQFMRRFAALKAEKQTTDRAGALWNFALARARGRRWDEAFGLFREALEVCGDCPARGQIHKNFGLVYGHSGDNRNAERELVRALELLPDDPEVAAALRIVRQAAAGQ